MHLLFLRLIKKVRKWKNFKALYLKGVYVEKATGTRSLLNRLGLKQYFIISPIHLSNGISLHMQPSIYSEKPVTAG